MKTETRNWLESAEYDIESARAMLASERYLYVIFLCHLTLEKLLKAIITEITGNSPPRIHDLLVLLKRTGVVPDPRYLDFLGKINSVSIPTRYPSDVNQLINEYPENIAQSYLQQTEEVAAWLKSRLILKG